MMDKRIGIKLNVKEAVAKALEELGENSINHFSFSDEDHNVVWAEKRYDGFRVYSNKAK